MIDDDLIQETLEARASASRPSLAHMARTVATSNPRVTARRGLRPVMSIAAATTAALIVATALLVLPGRSQRPGPSAGSPAPTLTTASPGATTTLAPALAKWSALTWYSGDDGEFEQAGKNVFMQAVEYWHDEWIAVGYSFDLTLRRVTGLVLHSDDGRIWSRDPGHEDTQFDRILMTPSALIVVGSHREPDIGDHTGPMRPAIWESSDGHDWVEVPMPASIDDRSVLLDVAIGGQGWLLRTGRIGVDQEGWLVGDPRTGWTDVTLNGDAFSDGYVQDIVGTAEGWLGAGMTGADWGSGNGLIFGDPKNDQGAFWRSTDGSNWIPAQIEHPGTGIVSIHQLAEGWIARGIDHGGCPRCVGARSLLWSSVDGQAWTPIDLDTSMNDALGWGLLATDGRRGLLFDVDESGRLRVRETRDGKHWSDIAVFLDSSAGALKPAIGGVIGVGSNGVVSFSDPSTESLDHFWMVPHAAIAGEPPASAATQSPAPPPENHDVVCPNGEPCGP